MTDGDGEAKYYTIREGDTLSAIARKHHTTVRALCRLNGIKESTLLRIGRRLRVR
ncbi:MAG: LysM peptidoglycan-binding domain-containing protein [Bacteroidales bacterium]|nr:LysM peptidoglycan-binding domain-containing protein [Bacteroidales bacterium]